MIYHFVIILHFDSIVKNGRGTVVKSHSSNDPRPSPLFCMPYVMIIIYVIYVSSTSHSHDVVPGCGLSGTGSVLCKMAVIEYGVIRMQ